MRLALIAVAVTLAVILLALPLPVAADTTTLQPSEADAYVMENDAANNFGGEVLIWVDSKEANQNWRSFVRFDLSSISVGSPIDSATLSLYMTSAPTATRTLEIQRVSATWGESTVTWNNQPGVGGSAVTTSTGTSSGVWLSWDVTTDVRDFILYQSATNHGWRIKDQTESSSTEYKESFYAREEAVETTLRPKLSVTYRSDPTVQSVGIYETDHSTPVTAMTPQIEYAVKVSATDPDTLANLSTVRVTIFHDSDGDDDAADVPGSGDTQNTAVLTCTVGVTPSWTIDAGSGTSWQLVTANCVQPTLTNTTGDFWFHFKPGKVATQAIDWDAYAVADDGGGTPGTLYDGSDYDMNWYGEITVNTGSIEWGTVGLGSDFDANSQTGISVTYICNGNYNQQVKSDGSWSGGVTSLTLNAAGSPGAAEFSLKADDTATLLSAALVSTATSP